MGTVNQINSTPPVTGTNTNNVNNPNSLAAFEAVLSLQSNDQLLGINANGTAGVDDSFLDGADLLNLSPAALNVLNGLETASQAVGANGVLGLNGALAVQGLTPTQQQQVAAIVAQFAGQPLTQATFTQIQTALTNAGIDPQQLSLQQLLGAYSYAFVPGFAFEGQLFTDTLAEELTAA